MKQFYALLVIAISLFVAGCAEGTQDTQETEEVFPHTEINEQFVYEPFTYPEEWDVITIHKDVDLRYQDGDNPENHRYAEVPYRYTITFGEEAGTNETTTEEIDEYNNQQHIQGESNRQVYYHDYEKRYATLTMSRNGFIHILKDLDEAEQIEISGFEAYLAKQDNQYLGNFYFDDTYYDLQIYEDADVQSKEAAITLFEMLVGQG
ncbi:hypothetical protein [Texcoconibacillus texcoconensis]|uniref:Lipoprotein n=1 Tax=Texcoconibacillus texcoconensis TaxID=1095777 RepID=A0A840QSD0_9BACI|nr:hypothetical protein [Texcoconibacillus texcoconensis]MBB5174250.1 hypothetical protein [Texcoconibacillus texcoconensis]